MKSRLGQVAFVAAIGFCLTGCTAPITIVPQPTNGLVSPVPVPAITLKFGSSFTSTSTDGLLVDGKLYQWGFFSPPPVANGTSSITNGNYLPNWTGGPFVAGDGYQHSLGISYTCGFFCVAGIPKFIFYPPYLTVGSQASTTQNTSLDIAYLPAGNWTQEWVAIQNAAPAGGVFVVILDQTIGGAATQLCSSTPACSDPLPGTFVTIPAGETHVSFYVNAIKSGPTTYSLAVSGWGCQSTFATGNINGS